MTLSRVPFIRARNKTRTNELNTRIYYNTISRVSGGKTFRVRTSV